MIVTTIYGDMDDSVLELRTPTSLINGNTVQATEYYSAGELVHRSISVILKPLDLAGEQATL